MTVSDDIRVLDRIAGAETSLGRVSGAVRSAFDARAAIREGESISWLFPFLAAGIVDFLDLIPFLGFIKLPLVIYLFIFNFGHGKWKVRLLRAALLFLDVIPFLSMLPFNLIVMLHTHHDVMKSYRKGQEFARTEGRTITDRMDSEDAAYAQQVMVQRLHAQAEARARAVAAARAADSSAAGGDAGRFAVAA